tara:strand:- start:3640 stop:6621 length:2982 start_codon:yes stop_codon:yes gene_type:complete
MNSTTGAAMSAATQAMGALTTDPSMNQKLTDLKETFNKDDSGNEKPIIVIFLDCSHSTMNYQSFNSHKVPEAMAAGRMSNSRGLEYIVCKSIIFALTTNYTENTNPSTGGSLATFLDDMSGSSTQIVSIGKKGKPPYNENTYDIVETAKQWYDKVFNHDTDHGCGTSFATAIRGFLATSQLSTDLKICFEFYVDGTSNDSARDMSDSFKLLLERYPKALISINAFVLKPTPRYTDTTGADAAGVDIYNMIPLEYLSNFKVTYLMEEHNGDWSSAVNPQSVELAVGDSSGSKMSICGIEFVIPDDPELREKLTRSIYNIICTSQTELRNFTKPQMCQILQNLDILAKYMDEYVSRSLMYQLMRIWLRLKGFTGETDEFENQIDQFLTKFIFAPKTAAILGDRVLRGQEIRAANFRQIVAHWERGNPVISRGMMGAPAILINLNDIRKMAYITITSEFLSNYDDKMCLWKGDSIVIPTIACPGMSNDDYARMAIRRIISVATSQFSFNINSRSIDIVAIIVLFAVMIRRSFTDTEYSRLMINVAKKMLDKEQLVRGVTKPSALMLISQDHAPPHEHMSCKLFGPNTTETLLYACKISDVFTDFGLPVPQVTDCTRKIDCLTCEPINGQVYMSDGQYYSIRSMERCIQDGLRSQRGVPYVRENFEEVDSSTLDTWHGSSIDGDPVTIMNLYDSLGAVAPRASPPRVSAQIRSVAGREASRSFRFEQQNRTNCHGDAGTPPLSVVRGTGAASAASGAAADGSGGVGTIFRSRAREQSDNPICIVVPGGLSSGKTSYITKFIQKLREQGVSIGTTLERHTGSMSESPSVFEHHPDSVSYTDGSFDRRGAYNATQCDKAWVRSNKPKFVIMNSNTTDGRYLGLSGDVLYLHGSLPPNCTETFTYAQWKNYVLFTIKNSKNRPDGFSLNASNSQIWYSTAVRKSVWIPQKWREQVWNEAKTASDSEIEAGWNAHIQAGNTMEEIDARIANFIETEITPRL